MSLTQNMIDDLAAITSNPDDFGVSFTFTNPAGETAIVFGYVTTHHLGIDTDGNAVNSKKCAISVAEKQFVAVGYEIRNTDGEVNLKDHKVDLIDSSGRNKKYIMGQWFPDEKVGLITCTLEDFENIY
jgi:hypothetical protein